METRRIPRPRPVVTRTLTTVAVLLAASTASAQLNPPKAPLGPPPANDTPGTNPPGIWVEPPRQPSARDRRRGAGEAEPYEPGMPPGQGCPVNERELELIV